MMSESVSPSQGGTVLATPPSPLRARCPDCNGRLSVVRVIAGSDASEYWAQRCTRCGGIHLDIVKAVVSRID